MFNKLIFVCILSLALTSSISGIRQKRKVVDELEPNEDLSKDDTIKLLQRLVATKTSEIVELEKENSEYKERLRQYEINNCLKYQNSSDLYIVNVPGIDPFEAPCESRLENGGWTVIQRRLDGSVNFDRNWNEYRNGFGDLKGEFFIGLEKLYRITAAQPQELLIYYETSSYQTDQERCGNFLIGSEREEYVKADGIRVDAPKMGGPKGARDPTTLML
ncbi:hypothetical protein ACLKA6_000316 [Drosophila palustris]